MLLHVCVYADAFVCVWVGGGGGEWGYLLPATAEEVKITITWSKFAAGHAVTVNYKT